MTPCRRIACVAAVLLISACGGGVGNEPVAEPVVPPLAAQTDVRTVRQVINPATGGSLRSDGLSLEFPAAALGSQAQEVVLVTRSAAPGAMAAFRLEPAGQRLQQPTTLSYTADALPANARFFWNIDGALTLMPGIPSGNTLRTTLTSLGYAAGGRRLPAHAAARAQRLGADDRARPLADGTPGGSIEVRALQCEVQANAVQARLAATNWYADQDLAIALHDELVALRASCADLQLLAIEQRTCDALTTAVDAATVVAIDSLPAFEAMVVSLHNAAAMVQNASATCPAASGLPPETRVDRLISAKFDQLLSFAEARISNAGLAGTATQQELAALMNLSSHCERLGLVAACTRIASELYPRVLDMLRSVAFNRCRASGTPEPARLHALGQELSTPQKFFGFASYSPAALEADLMYCTNPGLAVKVFKDSATTPEEITSRATTLDALGALGDYKRTATLKVPANGGLRIAGRAQALRCADGSASRADLVYRISGLELARYALTGDAYALANPALDLVLERDLARVGLPVTGGITRQLTLVREGGSCLSDDETVFNQTFTLFELTVEIEAPAEPPPPPPVLPANAWAGRVTLRYDFSSTWNTVGQRADSCAANDLNSATLPTCTSTDIGSTDGSLVFELQASTPAAINIGATGGELRLSVQSVVGSMAGTRATTSAGADGPCTSTGTTSFSSTAVPTSATPRRNWGLAVGSDGVLSLSTLSTLARPSAIDTTLRRNNVGVGNFHLSAGCPTGERNTTSGNSQDNPVVLLPPAVFGGSVDPAGAVWQGSQVQQFQSSGAACKSLGDVMAALLQIPGHSGTATCTATLTATWDLQRQ